MIQEFSNRTKCPIPATLPVKSRVLTLGIFPALLQRNGIGVSSNFNTSLLKSLHQSSIARLNPPSVRTLLLFRLRQHRLDRFGFAGFLRTLAMQLARQVPCDHSGLPTSLTRYQLRGKTQATTARITHSVASGACAFVDRLMCESAFEDCRLLGRKVIKRRAGGGRARRAGVGEGVRKRAGAPWSLPLHPPQH
jgi:hypothetical protein